MNQVVSVVRFAPPFLFIALGFPVRPHECGASAVGLVDAHGLRYLERDGLPNATAAYALRAPLWRPRILGRPFQNASSFVARDSSLLGLIVFCVLKGVGV